jgi:hypothetical protein
LLVLIGVLALAASAQPPTATPGVTVQNGFLVLHHPGPGLESRPDFGSHGIFITGGATLRLGGPAKPDAEYTIANDIQVDRGAIESIAGNPHFTGHLTVQRGGATLMTHRGGQDMFFDADITGAGPLAIDNDGAGGVGGTVRFTNGLSLMGAVTVHGPSPGFSGGRIYLADPDALNQATLVALAGMRGIDFDPAIKAFSLGGLCGNSGIDLKGKILRVGVANSDLVYSGDLTDSVGGGALIKSGSGSLTLTGHQGRRVGIRVYFGTLVIAGSVGSEVKVGDPRIPLTPAVLSGTGSCADILLQTPGAIVRPGPAANGAGFLAARNFSMIPGSTLSIRLGGAAHDGCDQIRASGQLSLYGNLEVTILPGFNPKPGDVFYIMTSAGGAPVLGRFSNLVSNEFSIQGCRFRINYCADSAGNDPAATTGHDIALIVLPGK